MVNLPTPSIESRDRLIERLGGPQPEGLALMDFISTVFSKLDDLTAGLASAKTGLIDVTEYGALGNGTHDDTVAIQAAFNVAKALPLGGTVVFPRPSVKYKITAPIVINNSSLTSPFAHRVNILGNGSTNTLIEATGFSGPAFSFINDITKSPAYIRIDGIRIQGNLTAGSIGVAINVGAFNRFNDLIIDGFDLNFYAVDMDQTLFERCNFQWGHKGIQIDRAVSVTNANSITFLDCSIINNDTWGLNIDRGNAIVFVNGSVQYNGTTGVAGEYGAKFNDPSTGYGTINIYGTIFEGNGGDYDLGIIGTTSDCQVNLHGVAFTRPLSTNYATNCILFAGTATKHILNMSGCNFRGYNSYVANAARPYLNITNANAKVFDDGTQIYGSATEAPSWAGKARIPTTLEVGSGITTSVSAPFRARLGTNQNVFFGSPNVNADGMALVSVDDAILNNKGLEVRASDILFLATVSWGIHVNTDSNIVTSSPFTAASGVALASFNDIRNTLMPFEFRASEMVFPTKIGFGKAGVAKQTLAAAATDAATTMALANDIRAKLINLGLMS